MSTYQKIAFEIKDNAAFLGLGINEEKSMTVLGEATLFEIKQALEEVRGQQKNLKGLIIHSLKDNCFLAGADINLIDSMESESSAISGAEAGQEIYNQLEDLKIPTVACVAGVCLGGGTEMVLACKTIIASNEAKFGLPEVKLGLIPGFGGTYRLPQKIGLPNALDLILTGKMIDARKSKKWGLVKEIYPKERLLDMAVLKHLKGHEEKSDYKKIFKDFMIDNFMARKMIFQKAREGVLKQTKGFYQAPLKILDVMESGSGKSRKSYLSIESHAFGELCLSEQSKNLRHVFFMTESVKKYSGPHTPEMEIPLKRGACIGAGTMGGGIAWLMADMGMTPIMKDLNKEGLELGLKQASSDFKSMLKRKKITSDEFEKKMRSIHATTSYNGLKQVDLVVEAIVEDLQVKKKVLAEVENVVDQDCLLTTNTSSLSVTQMGQDLQRPHLFAGLHFFNPVNKMPLVEIISHDRVSPLTLKSLHAWALKAKKMPVLVKDGPGFLVNRILMSYLNEAAYLLFEGVKFQDLEDACLNFGMPMGPCRLMDEVGLDVASKVAAVLYQALGQRMKPCDLTKSLLDQKLFGRKTLKGFYLYDEKGKETQMNPDLEIALPLEKIRMDEVDIQMRVFLPMINEAALILDEGLVSSALDVDMGLIFGTGFPPFRGGLLKYADHEGLPRILDTLRKFAQDVDEFRYRPAAYLERLVDQGQTFYR